MAPDARIPDFEQLPRVLPIFPLTGALVLPGGPLPLNIFEPRYLAMTRDALATPHRLIGMIQPSDPLDKRHHPDVYRIGCAGRIVRFEETADGRFLIFLLGVCRFEVLEELKVATPYRQVAASYARHRRDLTPDTSVETLDREGFVAAFRAYSERIGLKANWKEVDALACPFEPSEKQALLEAVDVAKRAEMMTAMMRMSDHAHEPGGKRPTLQ
jgi:Lon protease-like protein